jgi:WD40 repeat protein
MSAFEGEPRPERIASVADQVEPLTLAEPALSVHFLGEQAAFVGGESSCTLIAQGAAPRPIAITDGAILCATADHNRVVMGCDDGRVVAIEASGEATTLATDPKRRWIDCVALHKDGTLAWSVGKTAVVRSRDGGAEKTWEAPSTVGGLAFASKGVRLAVAHYGGATLWFPNMTASPERLEWAGSHLGVTFSPDNRFVVTAMHEPALHGWRLSDGRHMRMTGYPARVKSMAWCGGGKLLATSGADCVILWPFGSKDGPMGKEPIMLAPLNARVSCVAAHPTQDILAAGYEDGTVLLVRLPDGAEILAHERTGDAIAALGWSASGETLALATEGGAAGLLKIV